MPRLSPAKKPPVPPLGVKRGCYLEDGERLYRVLDAGDGMVKLENCLVPDKAAQWLPLPDVLANMRVVRRRR